VLLLLLPARGRDDSSSTGVAERCRGAEPNGGVNTRRLEGAEIDADDEMLLAAEWMDRGLKIAEVDCDA
jgi:hypothetical protein